MAVSGAAVRVATEQLPVRTIRQASLLLGVDLGGGHMSAALVDQAGRIIQRRKAPTAVESGPDGIISGIVELLREVISVSGATKRELAGIGLGIPGLIDSSLGLSIFSPNLFWHNVQVVRPIEREFNLPTFMDNDVRCATLAEAWYGAGRGVSNLICLTIGTGIGSGLMLEGQLVRGATESAGEIGHMTIEKDGPPCSCGNRGCLEALAAGPAIARRAREAVNRGMDTVMVAMVGGQVDRIDASVVAQAARQGDPVAWEIIELTALYLGIGIANYINLVNPELVIIGGGVAQAGELFLAPVRRVVAQRAMKVQAAAARVVPARLGEDAGVIGAAALVLERLGESGPRAE
ncbi:MAG: ROK family protein [Bacillota bacterium]